MNLLEQLKAAAQALQADNLTDTAQLECLRVITASLLFLGGETLQKAEPVQAVDAQKEKA